MRLFSPTGRYPVASRSWPCLRASWICLPRCPPKQAPQFNNDYTVRLSSQMASMPELSATATPTQQPSVKQPPLQSKLPPLAPRPAPKFDRPVMAMPGTEKPQAEVVPAEVMEEIRSLRKMFEQHLAGVAWGESARAEPVKTETLRQMLDAGFSPRFCA